MRARHENVRAAARCRAGSSCDAASSRAVARVRLCVRAAENWRACARSSRSVPDTFVTKPDSGPVEVIVPTITPAAVVPKSDTVDILPSATPWTTASRTLAPPVGPISKLAASGELAVPITVTAVPQPTKTKLDANEEHTEEPIAVTAVPQPMKKTGGNRAQVEMVTAIPIPVKPSPGTSAFQPKKNGGDDVYISIARLLKLLR